MGMAYQAFLGYYLGQLKRTQIRSKEELVEIANQLSGLMGLNEVPGIEKRTVGKMGLKGVAGVVLSDGGGDTNNEQGRFQQRGGGGSGRGGNSSNNNNNNRGGGRGGGRGGRR